MSSIKQVRVKENNLSESNQSAFLSAEARFAFRKKLLAWFDIHKRDLPWRRTNDPYAIWVSEIMLQQTRVAAVLDHYTKWMQKFPTIAALAASPEDEVLAAWSGLGYYRRARFLHKGAQAVMSDYGGRLPRNAEELRNLPGIGPYTSAAIASIAFGEPAAVVDGNVERVLLRQKGYCEAGATTEEASLSTAEMQRLANQLLDQARAGDYNQAVMELGATVCLPRNPLCLQCPVERTCRTKGEHFTTARNASIKVDIACELVTRSANGHKEVLLEQRPARSTVMPGMWELPSAGGSSKSAKPLLTVRHSIMQTSYRVSIFEAVPSKQVDYADAQNVRWIRQDELAHLPLTGLARKILLRLGLLIRQ